MDERETLTSMRGRRVVVLGGTAGIGFATARDARALGADVVITARDDDELRDATRRLGVTSRRVDAAERAHLDAFFADLGGLDHLVLSFSGGPAGAGQIESLDLTELRTGFEGKFWPYLNALQAALPCLDRQGSVTLVSAASAGAAMAGTAGFAAINGALQAMIPVLAMELKPLRVNAVSPGVIDTRFWSGMPETDRAAMFDQYAAAAPVGRIGSPDDVSRAIVSLIANDFITGTVITVDGGLTLAPAAA